MQIHLKLISENRLTSLRIWLCFVQILIVEILEYELWIMDKAVDVELKMLADYQLYVPYKRLMLASMAPKRHGRTRITAKEIRLNIYYYIVNN